MEPLLYSSLIVCLLKVRAVLHYPKIPGSKHAPLKKCIAFDKVDGTNLHWDWNREFGWHAFGTRRDQFNLTEPGIAEFNRRHAHLRESVPLFFAGTAEPVEQIFASSPSFQEFDDLKLFTEFVGPNSFAGLHKQDDLKTLVLLDVWADGFGMIGPEQFVEEFASLTLPRIVYRGKLTGRLTQEVRDGKFGVTEGVVCKGGTGGADV